MSVLGWKPVPIQNLEHEVRITEIEMKLGVLQSRRLDEVDQRFLHDAEVQMFSKEGKRYWLAIEFDNDTESPSILKKRITKIEQSPYPVLWVARRKQRLQQIAKHCESGFFAHLDTVNQKWQPLQGALLDVTKGAPIEVLGTTSAGTN